MKKIAQKTYAVYAIILFVITMIPVFLLVVIFRFLLKGGMAYTISFKLVRVWIFIWSTLIGVFYKRIVKEPVAAGKTFIFISNHISFFDIPAQLMAIRQPFRVLGEVDYSKIPLFGYLYNYITVSLDRTAFSSRLQSLIKVKNLLKRKTPIFIFPEGTFNETGNPLKDFYDGAFLIIMSVLTIRGF
jgi:1-acyl-sn-glycerol-3-phosphate acyltransferase